MCSCVCTHVPVHQFCQCLQCREVNVVVRAVGRVYLVLGGVQDTSPNQWSNHFKEKHIEVAPVTGFSPPSFITWTLMCHPTGSDSNTSIPHQTYIRAVSNWNQRNPQRGTETRLRSRCPPPQESSLTRGSLTEVITSYAFTTLLRCLSLETQHITASWV